jgi:hypothetical protein
MASRVVNASRPASVNVVIIDQSADWCSFRNPSRSTSRPDLIGIQDYALLVTCSLQDAPHGGCKCHWSPQTRGHIEDGRIARFQVTLKVGFTWFLLIILSHQEICNGR